MRKARMATDGRLLIVVASLALGCSGSGNDAAKATQDARAPTSHAGDAQVGEGSDAASADASGADGGQEDSSLGRAEGGPVGPIVGSCPTSNCVTCTAAFDQVVRPIDPAAVGASITTFGDNVAKSAAQRAALAAR
jgi:hypothetical protein